MTAALEALYAGLPGGLVIPCLLPVMTTAVLLLADAALTTGRNVLTPLMTPKRFVSRVYNSSQHKLKLKNPA